jgi:hypothetical protein
MRTLVVDAPPRRLVQALPPLFRGGEVDWLEDAGYHRRTVAAFDVVLDSRFVLDGEAFAGGELHVGRGPELEFVKP